MDESGSKTFFSELMFTALYRITAVLLTVFLSLSGCSSGGDTQSASTTTTGTSPASNDPSTPATPNTGPGTGGSESTGSDGTIPVHQLADLGRDQAPASQLASHRVGGAGEHQLEPGGLGQVHHLDEGDHRGGVHAGDAAKVDHQEPRRVGLCSLSDPLEQAVGRAEEHEPVDPQDLHALGHRAQQRPLGGRSTLEW